VHCSPRSNKHGRKRPYTEKYDDLHVIVLRSYISVSYTEKYGDIRTQIRSFTVSVNGGRIRSPFFSVYGLIRPYTDTEIYDRNTITCIPAKHGCKRPYFPRIRSYTTVYGVRNVRPG
jgi:hypothetical protein